MASKSSNGSCECNYECLTKWTKIITFSLSGAVIALGVQKFFNIFNAADIFGYIINVYLILLGIVLFFCELGWERVLQYFNFLRFYLGKAFFCCFLGLITFNTGDVFQMVVGIVSFVITILYIILGSVFRTSELQKIKSNSGSSSGNNNSTNQDFGSR